MARARVRYFAAAAAVTGRDETTTEAETLAALVAEAVSAAPEAGPVLARCSFLVDGRATTELATPVPAGALVDVLPPFAGG